jgi:predicted  nucleic acid-binding Zn-ribbon protein
MASSELEALLVLQGHDTSLDQLRHRKAHLPERDELRAIESEVATIDAAGQALAAQREVVAKHQGEVESQLAATEARIAELDARMYSGSVTASRDLQAMTEEIAHLKSRQSTLEDSVLEAMGEREPLDAQLERLAQDRAQLEARGAVLLAAVSEAESAIDTDVDAEVAMRATAADGVPPGLVAQYERLRDRLGGVGAARVEHGRCMGCHLDLSATEVDRLKHQGADVVSTCEQCGRILVP